MSERVTKLVKAILMGMISEQEAIDALVREGMTREDAERAILS